MCPNQRIRSLFIWILAFPGTGDLNGTLKKELRLLKSHLAATPATSLCLARRNLFPLSTSASWVHDIPLLSNASQSRVRLYEVIGPSSVEEGIWEGKGLFRMVLFQCQISTKASFLLYNSLLICPPMYSEVQDLLIFPPVPWLVHVQAVSVAGAACTKCPCCSCSALIQISQGNVTVILLPQTLWMRGAWPRRGRHQATQTMGHVSTLRWTTRIVKLCTGRAWVSLSASKVKQSLRSLCGSLDWGAWKYLLTFLRNITVLLQSSGVCGCHWYQLPHVPLRCWLSALFFFQMS